MIEDSALIKLILKRGRLSTRKATITLMDEFKEPSFFPLVEVQQENYHPYENNIGARIEHIFGLNRPKGLAIAFALFNI